MITTTFHTVTVRLEKNATEAVYAQIAVGSPEQCGCADCDNFAMQRDKIHPPEALELFQALGIDFRKEAEIWNADHFYGGWFHFIGEMVSGAENIVQLSPTYKLEFRERRDLLAKEFGNERVCQVDFYVENVPRLIPRYGADDST